MQIHHIGYLVREIGKSTKDFEQLGFTVEQEVQYDSIRKAFINLNQITRSRVIAFHIS